MPQLEPPTQDVIDTWGIEELGVRDGSSPTVNFDIAGSTAQREFLCNWDNRYSVAKWFVGDVSSYFDGSTKKISRLNPQPLPKPPLAEGETAWPDFHATKIIEITGHRWEDFDPPPDDEEEPPEEPPSEDPPPDDAFGNPMRAYRFTEETVNRFTCAKIKVQFERLPFTLMDDIELTIGEIERNVQFIPEKGTPEYVTLPASTQNYISETGTGPGHGVLIPYAVGITEATYKFTLRWHRIPYDCWGKNSALWARIFGDGTTASLPFLNAINETLFYFDSFAVGTVSLVDVTERLDPALLDSNHFLWTIDYTFEVKPQGWNRRWFFPNANEYTGAGNAAKRMFVGRGTTYYAPGSVPDLYSNFIERELNDVFNVDDGA